MIRASLAVALVLIALGGLLQVAAAGEDTDVDDDFAVTGTDVAITKRDFGLFYPTGLPEDTDVDDDGIVNGIDIAMVKRDVGMTFPTPTPTATPTLPPGRDKLRQPFASTSIWNMPIGSAAVLVDPGLTTSDFDGLEIENAIPIMAPTAPARQLRGNGDWWPDTACDASGSSMLVPVPDGLVVPAPPSGGDGSLPNRIGGVLLSDGATIQEFQYATRCNATGPLTAGAIRCQLSIYGTGQCNGAGGAQGGSRLSGVGGVLRLHELTGTIPHALKATLPAEVLSICNDGYRWPATAADGYAEDQYNGGSCALRMGSLVVLPQAYNCAQHAGLAERVCQALKDYGAYVGDTHPNGFEMYSIIGEWGTNTALDAVDSALVAMGDDLVVVDNNGPSSIGGGGSPLVPLAPAISN